LYYDDEGPEAWRGEANCRNYNPELWYPPRDKDLYKKIADQAKNICLGRDGHPKCQALVDCLLYAEKNDEQHGIWGGMSHRERNALRRKAEKSGSTLEEWVRAGKR